MTENMTGPVGRDKVKVRQSAHDLASILNQKQGQSVPFGIRRGTVTAITSITVAIPEPYYSVNLGGVVVDGVRNVCSAGVLVGDEVMLLASGPDKMIIGAVGNPVKGWTPQLQTSGAGQPAVGTGGVRAGYYKMIGPSLMWVYFQWKFGSAAVRGSGFYSLAGLPRPALYDQCIPVFYQKAVTGPDLSKPTEIDRRSLNGFINVTSGSPTTIYRFASHFLDPSGALNAGLDDGVEFGTGGQLVGEGVIAVQPG